MINDIRDPWELVLRLSDPERSRLLFGLVSNAKAMAKMHSARMPTQRQLENNDQSPTCEVVGSWDAYLEMLLLDVVGGIIGVEASEGVSVNARLGLVLASYHAIERKAIELKGKSSLASSLADGFSIDRVAIIVSQSRSSPTDIL